MRQKAFPGGRVWASAVSSAFDRAHAEVRTGVGCGVWGFTDFEVVSYLIFREKVPEFSPRSPQWLALFEGKKV
ncbi:hypothetical protein [Microcystis sp.]|uniref:hypothetical protein n=1 Tax=Microcystis sp. TaxID=1127 RepID=UPI003AF4782A